MTQTTPAGPPCPKCGQENPETVQFCTRCHTLLRWACPACHHLQPQGGKCDACGVDFTEYETKQIFATRERAAATPQGSRATLATVGAVAVVALAIGGWWSLRRPSDAPRPKAVPAVVAAVPAAPTGAPAVEGPLPADALRALQGLRALVQSRASFTEYGPRAFAARATVDRYVAAAGGDLELKRGARETMDLYMLAAGAWNASLRADSGDGQGAAAAFVSVSRDPALDNCPAARVARDTAKEDPRAPLEVMQGMGVASALPAIFECAESRLADVERRVAELQR